MTQELAINNTVVALPQNEHKIYFLATVQHEIHPKNGCDIGLLFVIWLQH